MRSARSGQPRPSVGIEQGQQRPRDAGSGQQRLRLSDEGQGDARAAVRRDGGGSGCGGFGVPTVHEPAGQALDGQRRQPQSGRARQHGRQERRAVVGTEHQARG